MARPSCPDRRPGRCLPAVALAVAIALAAAPAAPQPPGTPDRAEQLRAQERRAAFQALVLDYPEDFARAVETHVTRPLTDAVLFGPLADGGRVTIDAEGDSITLTFDPASAPSPARALAAPSARRRR